jgi:methionyl-tRNA formyltransferase
MRIVFLGEDSFSNIVLQSLLDAGHKVLSVICPLYHNNIHRRLQLTCEKNNIQFYREKDINSEAVTKVITKSSPDLIVTCHFQKLLKRNIISVPKSGCINLHPSLLPYYRGMSPQHWPIINGDKETGVTVHFIDEGIDTGDIILQRKIAIEEHMYVADLQKKMQDIYKFIIKDAIDLIARNNVNYIQQENRTGSFYGRLKPEHCRININDSYLKGYNLIRAVSKPYCGAEFGGYKIWKAHLPLSEKLSKRIFDNFSDNGIYFTTAYGNFIKFYDGLIMIDKFEKISDLTKINCER